MLRKVRSLRSLRSLRVQIPIGTLETIANSDQIHFQALKTIANK